MIAIPIILLGFGWLVLMVGQIWLIVVAFRTRVMWGFLSLLVPFASLIFLILYWSDAKQAFLTQVAGMTFVVLGAVVGMQMGMNVLDRMASDGSLQAQMERAMAEAAASAELAGQPDGEPVAVAAPENPDARLVGLPVGDLRELIGTPRGRLKTGRRLTLFYEGMEVIADDGERVSRVVYTE